MERSNVTNIAHVIFSHSSQRGDHELKCHVIFKIVFPLIEEAPKGGHVSDGNMGIAQF